jgi:hypothetical protein
MSLWGILVISLFMVLYVYYQKPVDMNAHAKSVLFTYWCIWWFWLNETGRIDYIYETCLVLAVLGNAWVLFICVWMGILYDGNPFLDRFRSREILEQHYILRKHRIELYGEFSFWDRFKPKKYLIRRKLREDRRLLAIRLYGGGGGYLARRRARLWSEEFDKRMLQDKRLNKVAKTRVIKKKIKDL